MSALHGVTFSAPELGSLLGFSERRVRELRDQAVLSSDTKGRYGPEAITAYCNHIRPPSGKAAAGGSEGAVDLDAARTGLIHSQKRKIDLQIQLLEAAVIPSEEMEGIVGAAFDATRAKLLTIPAAFGPRLAATIDPNDAREILTKAIHEALAELAEGEIVSSVKERARRLAGRIEVGDEASAETGASS